MKRFVLLFLLCAAFISTQALAAVIVTENWESGAGAWVDGGAGAAIVNDSITNLLGAGNHAIKVPGSAASGDIGTKLLTLAATTDPNWVITYDFYSTGTRDYLQIIGNNSGGSLAQLIALGHYNAGVDYTKYNYRVAFGSVNWQDTTLTRSTNKWHAMKIEQIYNPGDATATVNFYIDNSFLATAATSAINGVSVLKAGCGLTNGGGPAYFDNIVLTSGAIPEPGSMLALGAGMIGLLGVIRRRK